MYMLIFEKNKDRKDKAKTFGSQGYKTEILLISKSWGHNCKAQEISENPSGQIPSPFDITLNTFEADSELKQTQVRQGRATGQINQKNSAFHSTS